MTRIAVIVNPTAGRGAAGRRLPEIKAALDVKDCTAEYFQTTHRGHAEHLAKDAIAAGFDIVAAAGGDGTLHEVVNALLSCENCPANLGLIPFGTGNDFARAVSLRGSAEHMAKTLVSGYAHPIDIGIIESPSLAQPKWFLVAAGVGFVALTAKTVNDGIRGLTGPAAYVYGALKTLRHFVPEYTSVKIDGKLVFQGEATLISVSNVETTGGGIKIAPGAKSDDGMLDICIVDKVSRAKIAMMLPRAFSGKHVTDSAVSMCRGRKIEIVTANACPLWIDGEVVGATPATFTLKPSALKIMLPRKPGTPA